MDYKKELRLVLHQNFGLTNYKNFTQKKVTESVFKDVLENDKDMFLNTPSGSGKSLCYQLPVIIKKKAFAIVLTPSITLAKHQVDYLRSKNVSAYSWNAFTPKQIIYKIKNDLLSKNPSIKLVYTTPVIMAKVNFIRPCYIVIDEAHCMSSCSHDYRHCYKQLSFLRQQFSCVAIIAVSATVTKKVKEDIYKILKFESPVEHILPSFRKNIVYDVQCITNLENRLLDLKNFISNFFENNKNMEQQTCGIIYCKSQDKDILKTELSNIQARILCSNEQRSKKKIKMSELWDSGSFKIFIATKSFSLGFSKPSVRFVVHWCIPSSIGHYYQESGRAGHDDKLSFSRMYCTIIDKMIIAEKKVNLLDSQIANQPTKSPLFLELLNNLASEKCRHSIFSSYFEEIPLECKDKCDTCCLKNFSREEKSIQKKQFKPQRIVASKESQILMDLLYQ